MDAGSIALVGVTASGPGEAGTVDGRGEATRAREALADSDATGDPGACSVGAGGGDALTARVGVGVGVSVTVGRAVGRGVGPGVDRTVGFGVAEALTTIAPNICSGWTWQ